MKITHINPEGMHKNPAFSQAVVAEGGKTIYIGGQNGVGADGTVVGRVSPSRWSKPTRICCKS
jgi:enamine deaminase RidA (YjgF/YER057c/UK114 family)